MVELKPPPFPENLLESVPKIPPPIIPEEHRGVPLKCPPPLKIEIAEQPKKPSIERPHVEIIPGVIPQAPVLNLPPLPSNTIA